MKKLLIATSMILSVAAQAKDAKPFKMVCTYEDKASVTVEAGKVTILAPWIQETEIVIPSNQGETLAILVNKDGGSVYASNVTNFVPDVPVVLDMQRISMDKKTLKSKWIVMISNEGSEYETNFVADEFDCNFQ